MLDTRFSEKLEVGASHIDNPALASIAMTGVVEAPVVGAEEIATAPVEAHPAGLLRRLGSGVLGMFKDSYLARPVNSQYDSATVVKWAFGA